MTAILSDGYAAEILATPLLEKHYSHLRALKLRWFFTDQKPPKQLACKAFAAVTILTPLHRILSSGGTDEEEGDHVAIVVNSQLWVALTPAQQRAVVDHALAHIWVETTDDGDDKISRLEHDIGDFAHILERNGLYFDSMKFAAKIIARLGAEALG